MGLEQSGLSNQLLFNKDHWEELYFDYGAKVMGSIGAN